MENVISERFCQFHKIFEVTFCNEDLPSRAGKVRRLIWKWVRYISHSGIILYSVEKLMYGGIIEAEACYG